MSKFEKFVYKRLQAFGRPAVTITKVGMLNFNVGTMKTYVKDNDYAILYFDKDNSIVGIQFTKKKSPEAYHIRAARDGKFGAISGIAFLHYYKIPYNTTTSYFVDWDEKEQMLVLDLKQHKKVRGVSNQIPGQERQ